jgi:hypothetical protein
MKRHWQQPLETHPVERSLLNMLIFSSRDLVFRGIGEHNARGQSADVDVEKASFFAGRFLRPTFAALESVKWRPTSMLGVIEPAPAGGRIGDPGF